MNLYTSFPKNEYVLMKKEIDHAIQRVLDGGVYVLGDQVKLFEKEFAEYVGLKHCVGMNNGTDAIFLALKALGIGPGDEVITTPFTAAFTSLPIAAVGARPVFVDIRPDTYNIDETKIERAITRRTKAILPVYLFGQPANILEIKKIAKKHNLFLIEDACQAHGAMVGKKMVGTFGDAVCFSFYPTKNLGAIGDGGAVLTNNTRLAQKLRLLMSGGQTSKYYHEYLGYNTRLDEIQAAILRVKLQHFERSLRMREQIAAHYDRLITNPAVVKPARTSGMRHVFHLYVIQTPKRDALQQVLERAGVHTQVHYPWPLHLLPAFSYLPQRRLPIAEQSARTVLSLPMYPGLQQKEIKKISMIVNAGA